MDRVLINAREDISTGCVGESHKIVGAYAVRKSLEIGTTTFALGEQRTSQSA
jgi:hypothetical protein